MGSWDWSAAAGVHADCNEIESARRGVRSLVEEVRATHWAHAARENGRGVAPVFKAVRILPGQSSFLQQRQAAGW